MKKLRLILLGAVVAMGSAVASASAGATSTVGQQYLHDVAPLNAAVTKWIAESNEWTKSTTISEIRAQTSLYDAALHVFQSSIHDQRWPKRTTSAVDALYKSLTALEGKVTTLEKSSAAFDRVYLSEVQGQDSITASKANPLRHDLGLSPLKKSTYQSINHQF